MSSRQQQLPLRQLAMHAAALSVLLDVVFAALVVHYGVERAAMSMVFGWGGMAVAVVGGLLMFYGREEGETDLYSRGTWIDRTGRMRTSSGWCVGGRRARSSRRVTQRGSEGVR